MYGDIMNNGFKIVGNLKNCKNVTDWVNRMAHFGGYGQIRAENSFLFLVNCFPVMGRALLP